MVNIQSKKTHEIGVRFRNGLFVSRWKIYFDNEKTNKQKINYCQYLQETHSVNLVTEKQRHVYFCGRSHYICIFRRFFSLFNLNNLKQII